MTPKGAPFGGFCPATSISLRRRPLPGIFQAGPVLLNRRTPAHPRQPDLTTMPRHTGAPGALSGPARFWAAQSPPPCPHVARGDHFPRTRSLGSCVSPPNPAPAPPRHNALWCIRGRNAMSLGPAFGGGEECVASGLILLGNWGWPSPAGGVRGRMLRGPRFAWAPQHEECRRRLSCRGAHGYP